MKRLQSRPLRTLLPLGALAGALLGGCASTPPSSFYTLAAVAPPAESAAAENPLSVTVGPLLLPEYLDRPQIVTRDTPTQLTLDEFQRWGGSLREDLLRTIAMNLGVLLNTDRIVMYPNDERLPVDFRVLLSVEQFDGALGQSSTLITRWTVVDASRDFADADPLVMRRSVIDTPVSGVDYNAYVTAGSRSVEALSREIARAILSLPGPR